MPDDRAFLESYGHVELKLPTGEMLKCRALDLEQSTEFIRLLMQAQAGDGEAMLKLMDTFPVAIGAKEAFKPLSPAEFFEVLRDFFTLRPIRNGTKPTE